MFNAMATFNKDGLMKQLSVTIITKNAEATLERCLAAVAWADQIVVVDSGSTDNTLAIARRYTHHIIETDWPGYGKQKNRAIDHATHDWILAVDADEIVTPELAAEIQQVLADPKAYAYQLKIQLIFNDRAIKHAVGADRHIRLFEKHHARFRETPVHECVETQATVLPLKASLQHYSFVSIDNLLNKMNHYSSLTAAHRVQAGKRAASWLALPNAIWTFIRLYLLKGGFLDGKEGLVLAFSFAEGAFYRYMKTVFLAESTADDNQLKEEKFV